MCQGRSGDKTVITAQTMSLVQRSDGKIKAVWSGHVPSVKRSCPGDCYFKGGAAATGHIFSLAEDLFYQGQF